VADEIRPRGTVVYGLEPLVVDGTECLSYLRSYGHDSDFFVGLAARRIMGSACPVCGHKHAPPRAHCLACGARTRWFELPHRGVLHTYTTVHPPGRDPVTLALVEFEGVDGLLLARYEGAAPAIGQQLEARFRSQALLDAGDLYFVPAGQA
jgi:uncharacterized OB-fold protein